MLLRLKSFVSHMSVCIALVAIAGCAKYNPRPLQHIVPVAATKQNVQVAAQAFSVKECKHYLSRNAIRKGLQPIQLSVKNSGTKPLELNAHNIALNIKNSNEVAHCLHLNTKGRVLGWGIPGLFFSLFLVTAIVEGVWSSEANKKLDRDFDARVISNNSRFLIMPGTTCNKILFVNNEDYVAFFDIKFKVDGTSEVISLNVPVL